MKKPVVLLSIIVLFLALAAALAWWKWDIPVLSFFLRARIPHKAPWLLALGEFGRPLTPFWLLLIWAWLAKRPRVLLAGLLAMLLTLCAVLPIKSAVGRIRPDQEPAEVMHQPFYKRSYSFPSGDATLAFAVATAAAGFIASAKLRWLPFLPAAMAGVTRLMLFRHFASDVIAGAALGILCGYAALRISRGSFVRGALSRVPPACWRPAFGAATLLYLIFDLAARGPVSHNFLSIFWSAVVFAFILSKGPACLRRLRWPADRWRTSIWMKMGVVTAYVASASFCAVSLCMACFCMYIAEAKWPWFLPAAVVAILGVCWVAPAFWRKMPGRALSRMTATAVLSFGMTLETFNTIEYLFK
jgi:membrane-associated phospholipid phosphatase